MGIREFNKVLKQIASDFDLDGAALVKYAREDTIKGEDEGNPDGTAYTSDGKLLYALVRLLQPETILEIGTYRGGSTVHMAAACKKNSNGHITSVDIWDESGLAIPDEYLPYVSIIHSNIDTILLHAELLDSGLQMEAEIMKEPRRKLPRCDFIFEDGPHSEHSVHNIYGALPYLLKPGGLILSHDTATGMQQYIRNGMRKGGANLEDVRFYEIPGNPCGMSVYRFEGYDDDT